MFTDAVNRWPKLSRLAAPLADRITESPRHSRREYKAQQVEPVDPAGVVVPPQLCREEGLVLEQVERGLRRFLHGEDQRDGVDVAEERAQRGDDGSADPGTVVAAPTVPTRKPTTAPAMSACARYRALTTVSDCSLYVAAMSPV
ncbi:hypothetical protein [Streptomyces canus]|uniref:hypothetical protein n=1 Tax=Streptomyces canus TaxID=58343 RepID=UPI003815839B